MTVYLVSKIDKWIGLAAERTAITPDKVGSTFFATDSKVTYIWTGAAWAAM